MRRADGAVWLEKRPDSGVWAGLYCLPVFDSPDSLRRALPAGTEPQEGAPFVHVLTHKDLHLHPVAAELARGSPAGAGGWFAERQWRALGLPAPVRKMLEEVHRT